MGMGDVKMLAMIGAFLGWRAVLLTLVLSSFAGALVGIALMPTQRGGMRYALPFGTFLALGRARGDAGRRADRHVVPRLLRSMIALQSDRHGQPDRHRLRVPRPDRHWAWCCWRSSPRAADVADARNANDTRAETTMLSVALEEAMTRLKAQERATAARAEASERLRARSSPA